VRDAHLGSIWEGTSNIVALDIARAAKRDGALDPLRDYLNDLLCAARLPAQSLALLRSTFARACDALASVAESGRDEAVRQAGSALYHASTAILMACEGAQLAPDYRRLALAHLVLRHKLLPSDPLDLHAASDDADVIDALVNGRAITLDQAMQLLPAGGAQ
jgi:acyl-CoA dehydrogenase